MAKPRTVILHVADVGAAIPVNEKLKPGPGGIVFTLHPDLLDGDVPAYRDPSHLGAWLSGYWSGVEATTDGKETK